MVHIYHDRLCEESRIRLLTCINPLCNSQIKISVDGVAISHSSNLLVCSFAILEDGNVMSSSGMQVA